MKTPNVIETIRHLVKRARDKNARTMTRAHAAILDQVETAFGRGQEWH